MQYQMRRYCNANTRRLPQAHIICITHCSIPSHIRLLASTNCFKPIVLQKVKTNFAYSSEFSAPSGVPQGSHLGPTGRFHFQENVWQDQSCAGKRRCSGTTSKWSHLIMSRLLLNTIIIYSKYTKF